MEIHGLGPKVTPQRVAKGPCRENVCVVGMRTNHCSTRPGDEEYMCKSNVGGLLGVLLFETLGVRNKKKQKKTLWVCNSAMSALGHVLARLFTARACKKCNRRMKKCNKYTENAEEHGNNPEIAVILGLL